jgi:hypothetical protein
MGGAHSGQRLGSRYTNGVGWRFDRFDGLERFFVLSFTRQCTRAGEIVVGAASGTLVLALSLQPGLSLLLEGACFCAIGINRQHFIHRAQRGFISAALE